MRGLRPNRLPGTGQAGRQKETAALKKRQYIFRRLIQRYNQAAESEEQQQPKRERCQVIPEIQT